MKHIWVIGLVFAAMIMAGSPARAEVITLSCRGKLVEWNLWIDTLNNTVTMQDQALLSGGGLGPPVGPMAVLVEPNFFIWSPGFNRQYTIDRTTGVMTFIDPNTIPPLTDRGMCQKITAQKPAF